MNMIIPQPIFGKVPIDMHGYSIWRQIISIWKNPPCFYLLEDWHVTLADGTEIVIPKGFITDFASIPRVLWPIIEPDGPLCVGSILHDFGYQHGYFLTLFKENVKYEEAALALRVSAPDKFGKYIPYYTDQPQIFFDGLLRDATIQLTGATVQAKEAYVALRGFGYRAWDNYRAKGPGAFGCNSLGLPGRTK